MIQAPLNVPRQHTPSTGKLIRRFAGWVCTIWMTPVVAAFGVEEIGLQRYLELSLEHHLTQKRHEASLPAEQLNLKDGERLYWPDVTFNSNYDEETAEKEKAGASPKNRTVKSGITSGVDTGWRSPLGTELTLGLEHQYGRQLGMKAQGIPEEELTVHNLSFELSQPLLKGNTPGYNRLEKRRAQTQWQRYLTEGDRNRLTIMQEAMSAFLDLQQQQERLRFQLEQLTHYRYLENVTATLVKEERSIPLELDIAALDVARQDAMVDREAALYRQQLRQLTLGWVGTTDIRVATYPNMTALMNALEQASTAETTLTNHPEYKEQQLNEALARLQVENTRKDRWPDLELYYRYDKHFREALPDEENNTWGVRVSYALFDLPTRQRQAQARAERTIEHWNTQDTLKRLEWQRQQLIQEGHSLTRELELADQRITLSRRALEQELVRYQAGRASYADVQNRQKDLLDWQLDRLGTQTELATNHIELAYLLQLDWPALIHSGKRPLSQNKRSDS